jgi:protein-tyrosine phosphatase
MLGSGASPPGEVATAMAGRGLDVRGHQSRQVTAGDLARADLILGMAREHVRHAVVVNPQAWPRAFTILEVVRRGDLVGPRPPGETLAAWLARAHAGRDGLALLGDSAQDDVADPIGGPPSAYERTAAELEQLIGRLADLCWVAGAHY